MCTVATASRIDNLHRLAKTWPGILSVAFLTPDLKRDSAVGLHVFATPTAGLPPHPHRFRVTLVQDVGYSSPLDRFPTNMLRNIASEGCPQQADTILMIDVDFVLCSSPEKDIENTLMQYALAIQQAGGNLSFVLPGAKQLCPRSRCAEPSLRH